MVLKFTKEVQIRIRAGLFSRENKMSDDPSLAQ